MAGGVGGLGLAAAEALVPIGGRDFWVFFEGKRTAMISRTAEHDGFMMNDP